MSLRGPSFTAPEGGLIAFDFDGVLSKDPDPGYGWSPEVADFGLISQAHEHGYAVAVMTCNDVQAIAAALCRRGFRAVADPGMRRASWDDPEVVLVTGRKLVAVAYVDDRAIGWRYGQDPELIWFQLACRR